VIGTEPVTGAHHGLPPDRARQIRQLRRALYLTGVVMIIEAAGGVVSGSLALLSDAGHMLTDLLALVLSVMACGFASLPANSDKTYGYHRLEILTALVNGSVLVLVSGLLAWSAVGRFLHPSPIHGSTMLWVALLGLLGNIACLSIIPGGHDNLNIRGARMHILGDALSSAGVVATSILIALTGETRLDPVIAGVIAVVICVGAVRLVREAVDVLLEAAPAGIALDEVSAAIRAVPGVLEVHDLHVWSITTGLPALSGHVRIDARSAADGDEMLARIKEILRGRFLIEHTTLQVETPGYQQPCEDHS
jgi:cobalt-zinc-cadmium efflux system protein